MWVLRRLHLSRGEGCLLNNSLYFHDSSVECRGKNDGEKIVRERLLCTPHSCGDGVCEQSRMMWLLKYILFITDLSYTFCSLTNTFSHVFLNNSEPSLRNDFVSRRDIVKGLTHLLPGCAHQPSCQARCRFESIATKTTPPFTHKHSPDILKRVLSGQIG